MRIYTKAGDAGQTQLLSGSRVPKDHPRVTAYGDVDELNAALGAVRAHSDDQALRDLLRDIQRKLFALGAHLADPGGQVVAGKGKAGVARHDVAQLEQAIDEREAELPPLTSFVLPGGSRVGSLLHVARTVCRRAERAIATLARDEELDPVASAFTNRLSDLLFVLARHENLKLGTDEERW